MNFVKYCEELFGQPLAPFQKELCNAFEENYKKNNGKIVINKAIARGRSSLTFLRQLFLFILYEEEMKKHQEENNDKR